MEFINTFADRKTYFKRVYKESEKTYKIAGSQELYERQNSNVDRYLARENCPYITLAEFITTYDFVGHRESQSLYKVLSVPGVEIKNSSYVSAFSPNDYLPEFIITRDQEVMKVRTNRKIISYPCTDDDPSQTNYTKALLFYPFSQEVSQEEADDIIKRASNADDSTTMVKQIER